MREIRTTRAKGYTVEYIPEQKDITIKDIYKNGVSVINDLRLKELNEIYFHIRDNEACTIQEIEEEEGIEQLEDERQSFYE